jgi:uncharacterized protein involved in exopolysaccharide biosynthesis
MHNSLNPENKDLNPISTEYNVLDLSDIWQALRHSWILIISATLLSTLIALILALTLSKQWNATATLRIGHIPPDTSEFKLITSEPKVIEAPLQTIERLKLMGFKQKVLIDLGLPTEEGVDRRTDLFVNSLKGNAIQNTDFISLSIRGYTANEARNSLKAVVKEIQAAHILITMPLKNRTFKESLVTTTALANTTREIAELKSQMTQINKSNSAFAPSIVAINLLTAKETEEQSLQSQHIQDSARLDAFDEQATTLVNTIDVSTKPVFPKRSIFLAIGALLGLLVGTWLAILKYKKILDGNAQ